MEVVAEHGLLDVLLDDIRGDPKKAAQVMDDVLKQSGIEMTPMELKWLGDVAAKVSALQQNPDFATEIALEMLSGKSGQEAQAAASKTLWEDVLNREIRSEGPDGILHRVEEGFTKMKNKVTEAVSGIRNAIREGRLNVDSTEQQRYELLKDAVIEAVPVNESAIEGVNLEDYNTGNKKAVTPGFITLADNLGIVNVDLNNCELDFSFQFSKNNLRKSLNHQSEYGGSYQDYVKAMSCFNELVENAVPIETHEDKKKGTIREDSTLKQVYVLVSAIQDGENVIPIELEVKTFKTRSAQLYMTVALTKIDSGVLEGGLTTSAEHPPLFPESTYTLQSVFENVNPKDNRFLKYIPDQFLNEAQRQAKQEALNKQEKEYEAYGESEAGK